MEFGKLDNIDGLLFEIPADDPKNFEIERKVSNPPQIYIGCPIWVNKLWEDKIYPKGTPSKDYLKFYAERFNTIELNSTHYHTPDERMVSRWKESVEENFRFSPKLPQSISHHKQLRKCQDEVHYFLENIQLLKENLGTSFLQLPPHFSLQEFKALEDFFKILPNWFSLALEFRHPSWFTQGKLAEEAFHLLQEYNVSPVITDVSGRRDVLHTSLTGKTALIRFIGNSMHPTDFKRVDDWVVRLVDWLNSGLESIYFFAHQPDNTLAPELASYFIKKLNEFAELNKEDPLRPLPQSQVELF